MYNLLKNVSIEAVAATVPSCVLDNEDFADRVNDKKYKRRILYTGIKQRRTVTGDQRTSDLATIAAEAVCKKLHWAKDSIGVLIFVTQSPDLVAPSTAMIIQKNLGLSKDVMAFDVNWGCAGFTSGVQLMAGLLNSFRGRGLLLVGDCQHYMKGEEYAEDAILFGDAGAAIAMEYDEDAVEIPSFNLTDGNKVGVLYSGQTVGRQMNGNEIVFFSLNEVVNSINDFHNFYGVSREEIDYYALHQAQKIIVDGIVNNCRLPVEKVLKSYEYFGNTSSASAIVTLCSNTNVIKGGNVRVFSCGYGIGLIWSGVLFNIDKEGIIPLIESDYVYAKIKLV